MQINRGSVKFIEKSDHSSKSAFHDKKNKKLREGIYIPPKKEEEKEEGTNSMDRETTTFARGQKEWSICSTKSSSSEPTDEEIADLVQRQGIFLLRISFYSLSD